MKLEQEEKPETKTWNLVSDMEINPVRITETKPEPVLLKQVEMVLKNCGPNAQNHKFICNLNIDANQKNLDLNSSTKQFFSSPLRL